MITRGSARVQSAETFTVSFTSLIGLRYSSVKRSVPVAVNTEQASSFRNGVNGPYRTDVIADRVGKPTEVEEQGALGSVTAQLGQPVILLRLGFDPTCIQ